MTKRLGVGVLCHPTFGGSGVVAAELAATLARRGHAAHLFSYAPPARFDAEAAEVRFHLVEVFAYPLFKYPPYDLALASKVLEVAESEPLDLLHAHYAVPHAIAAYLARACLGREAIRVVTTLHGTDITLVGADPSYRRMTQFGIEESDAVTCVSEALRRETERAFPTGRPLEVIPNFVDTDAFRPRARGAKRGPLTVVHVSNFRPVKRTPDVIAVFARLARETEARLLLVGDGPDQPRAHAAAAAAGVSDRVRFLGERAAVASVLAEADLFLLASETESFGLSALEAMACGVPVVAPEVGGLPEVVADGECGFLRPAGDLDALAEACLRLLRDEDLRRRFGEAARRRAVERFERDAVVERYLALYERVLAAPA